MVPQLSLSSHTLADIWVMTIGNRGVRVVGARRAFRSLHLAICYDLFVIPCYTEDPSICLHSAS